jgi:RNA 2',3'-cyclic 3'-phosphodiesterase
MPATLRPVRLFVAVWPPPAVVSLLDSLDRPHRKEVRWTTPDQWHVTLRFLGEADPDEVATALRPALAGLGARDVVLGPVTRRLSSSVLVVPVSGLDDVAAALPFPEDKPFRGHLTIARSRGRTSIPAALAGAPASAGWRVDSVSLVRSTLSPKGARYDDVEVFGL